MNLTRLAAQAPGQNPLAHKDKMMKAFNDHTVIELRNHFIDLYQRVAVNLLQKNMQFGDRFVSSEREWTEALENAQAEL